MLCDIPFWVRKSLSTNVAGLLNLPLADFQSNIALHLSFLLFLSNKPVVKLSAIGKSLLDCGDTVFVYVYADVDRCH